MTVQALRKTSVSFDSARRDAAHFIDGAFTDGSTGKFWENRTPLDNSVIGRVPEGGKAEIDAACRAAKAALSGPWGKMTVAERTDILGKVADGDQRPARGVPRRRVPRHRQAVEPRPPPRHSARRRQFQDVRRHGERGLDRDLHAADAGRQGRAELWPEASEGRHRGDLARGTCRSS